MVSWMRQSGREAAVWKLSSPSRGSRIIREYEEIVEPLGRARRSGSEFHSGQPCRCSKSAAQRCWSRMCGKTLTTVVVNGGRTFASIAPREMPGEANSSIRRRCSTKFSRPSPITRILGAAPSTARASPGSATRAKCFAARFRQELKCPMPAPLADAESARALEASGAKDSDVSGSRRAGRLDDERRLLSAVSLLETMKLQTQSFDHAAGK